jgi:hypothetical protein
VSSLELNVDVKKVIATQDEKFKTGMVYFNSDPTWSEDDEARCSCVGECLPSVNLSRSGSNPNCWMRLDSLSNHNHHAPAFESEGEMEYYTQRVTDSITAAVHSWENSSCDSNAKEGKDVV